MDDGTLIKVRFDSLLFFAMKIQFFLLMNANLVMKRCVIDIFTTVFAFHRNEIYSSIGVILEDQKDLFQSSQRMHAYSIAGNMFFFEKRKRRHFAYFRTRILSMTGHLRIGTF